MQMHLQCTHCEDLGVTDGCNKIFYRDHDRIEVRNAECPSPSQAPI